MDLVVTTPGVSTATVRTALDSESESRDRLLVIDRATRCGSTTVDPTDASRLRVAVAPCAVSLHSAERFCARFADGQSLAGPSAAGNHPVDGIVVCQQGGASTEGRLESRFDCPVSALPVGDGLRRGRYCER